MSATTKRYPSVSARVRMEKALRFKPIRIGIQIGSMVDEVYAWDDANPRWQPPARNLHWLNEPTNDNWNYWPEPKCLLDDGVRISVIALRHIRSKSLNLVWMTDQPLDSPCQGGRCCGVPCP